MAFKQISETIGFLRKKANITQKQLADIAGVGKTVIFDIEKGKETVRFSSLLKVLNALNIKIELKNPLLNNIKEITNEDS